MEANKYQQGKIYKIISPQTDKIYVGSTIRKTLAQRLTGHRRNYKQYLAGQFHYVSSFEILQHPDYRIILIESYPCNSKDKLLAQEQKHIDQAVDSCVNKHKAFTGLTRDEYKKLHYEQNKDEIAEKKKNYYNENKDEIAEKKKNYYNENKDKIQEYIKHYSIENKATIAEKRSQKIQCDCGLMFTKLHKSRHEKSFIHNEYIKMTL